MVDSSKQVIEQEVRKHEAVLVSAGFSIEEVTTAFINTTKVFVVVIETIEKQVKEISKWFDEYNFALEEIHETEIKREMYKLDFSRPVIRHQVIDRKPKRLIKKVIH
ncbi:MAG: hypothetical protein RR588_00350 [Solibacillus sp.]